MRGAVGMQVGAAGADASRDAALRLGVAPPPDYYRSNLLRILRFVTAEHADLLRPADVRFIAAVEALGVSAQRLFARLVSRKGPLLRRDRLAYAEVPDLDAALKDLAAAGLVALNPQAPAERLLSLLTRAELRAHFTQTAGGKAQRIERILAQHSAPCLVQRMARLCPWLAVAGQPSLSLVQLLFFGDPHKDLSTFILEDLGWVRHEDYPLDGNQRLFQDRGQLDAYLRARQLNEASHWLDELPCVAKPLGRALRQCTAPHTRLEAKTLSRALNRLGRWLERRGELQDALACYRASTSHPNRERQVRILHRQGRREAAEALLQAMRRSPSCAEEADFARHFGQRRKRPPPNTTEVRESPPADVPVERFAMQLLTASGGEAWHLENLLPRGLAALAFWEVLFAPVPGAFLNPYQDAPLDLYWADFAKVRQDAIAGRRRVLADPERFAEVLRTTCKAKAGVANRLMNWRHITPHLVDRLLAAIPHKQLLHLACRVIENPAAARTGFPDLLVLRGASDYEFVEVKGPKDSLRPAQRRWLEHLDSHGFNARVLKFKP